jgi:hypothetical protein
MGKGESATSVNLGLDFSIKKILKPNTAARLIKYIMAGPTYILTLLTSSEIRFIRSPVLWVL